MFAVYAVRLINGVKHRHFLDTLETLDEAKHLANCATGGNADYAYVKDSTGGTIFFLRPISYDPQPLTRPLPQWLEGP